MGTRIRGDKLQINGNLSKTIFFIKDMIKLFKLTIKHDKLYLNPYQN